MIMYWHKKFCFAYNISINKEDTMTIAEIGAGYMELYNKTHKKFYYEMYLNCNRLSFNIEKLAQAEAELKKYSNEENAFSL